MKSFVYFISNGVNIKIGKANDVQKRMKMLQTGSSLPLELLGYIGFDSEQEARKMESDLHHEFSEYRTQGEWFSLSRMQAIDILDYWEGEILSDQDIKDWVNLWMSVYC